MIRDFIKEYKDTISVKVKKDHPVDMIEAAALMIVSVLAGRDFHIMSVTDKGFAYDETEAVGGKILNLWFWVMAPSRVGRKTSVTRDLLSFLKCEKPEILLPTISTPEALVDKLASRVDAMGYARGAWINDEVTGFFKLIQKGGYASSADADMSKLYDGDTISRDTKSGGHVIASDPYFNMWIATTEALLEFLSEHYIKQGFMNRPIFIVNPFFKAKKKSFKISQEAEEKRKELRLWVKTFANLGLNGSIVMDVLGNTRKEFEAFEEYIDKKALRSKKSLGDLYGYFCYLPELCLKLAAIYRLARIPTNELKDLHNIRFLDIELEDIKRAKHFSMKSFKYYNKLLELMDETYISQPLRSNRYARVIERKLREAPLTLHDLYKRMGKGFSICKEYYNALYTLELQGIITAYLVKKSSVSKNGRTVYYHKSHTPPDPATSIKIKPTNRS